MIRKEVDVCIVGGGPAGMIMGLLLAKQGVKVLVLERNKDFDREYRGEVMQPRFLQMMSQLGLRGFIESYPHIKLEHGGFFVKNKNIAKIDFSTIIPDAPYALWMPQPILLNALHDKAKTLHSFELWFHTQVKQLIQEDDHIKGVVAETQDGPAEIRAKVTVGADGRFSLVRKLGHFELEYEHYENDVAWFTTRTPEGIPKTLQLLMSDRHFYLVLPKYPDSIQGGITMKKGTWKQLQEQGIENLKKELSEASPAFAGFAKNLSDFKSFTLLQAKMLFVREWAKNGCLLIGDAAHCASPAGGVGVSLSTATAVVAADVVFNALKKGDVSARELNKVQDIRSEEIRFIHRLQLRQEKLAIPSNRVFRVIRPYFVALLSRTPLFAKIQRKVLIQASPLSIDEKFSFADEMHEDTIIANKLG